MSNACRLLVLSAALLAGGFAAAQIDDLRLPVIIDADRTDYDGRTSMLRFTALRLTQGGISIQADVAHASRMDFDDSVWQFSGNVVFDVNEGHVTCDSADLQFSDFQLQQAVITGSPATFRFARPGGAEPTFAEAGKLVYDVRRGIIEFSDGATISEGGNQIAAESLVYNIREQRINAASSGNGGDRVTVTYTPPQAAPTDGRDAVTPPDEEDDAAEAPSAAPDDAPATDPPATEPPASDGDAVP